MKSNKLQSTFYTIGMILVIIIASMNVLNYAVPKNVSYFVLLVAGLHFFFLFAKKYK